MPACCAQREAVRKTVPDAVNPLLIGQNLRERLDEGLIDQQSFGAAMSELKQAVGSPACSCMPLVLSAMWRPDTDSTTRICLRGHEE